MRTKLILGLTVSVMTAAQLASAQGVSDKLTAPVLPDTSVGNYVEVIAVPTTGVTINNDAPSADLTAADVTSDESVSLVKAPADDSLPAISMSFTDSTTAQQFVAATDFQNSPSPVLDFTTAYQTKHASSTSDNWAADGNWMSVVPLGQSLFAPVATQDSASVASATPTFESKGISAPAGVGEIASAGATGGDPAQPQLLNTPEPSTIGLMIVGGTTLLGALRRRK